VTPNHKQRVLACYPRATAYDAHNPTLGSWRREGYILPHTAAYVVYAVDSIPVDKAMTLGGDLLGTGATEREAWRAASRALDRHGIQPLAHAYQADPEAEALFAADTVRAHLARSARAFA
jgi:hypothetical protein